MVIFEKTVNISSQRNGKTKKYSLFESFASTEINRKILNLNEEKAEVIHI